MAHLTYMDMGLNEEEYRQIVRILDREPNTLEVAMFSVMWSEHCGYKNSRALLKNFPTTGSRVIQGPGENAGVIDIGDGHALVFKIESHNHPSAIEPYQGAATGVGGIVRDIFTMGARPVALLNSLRFGSLENTRVRELLSGVVAGIAGYGNCLGIPNVGGEVYFNPVYKDNPLVNAMCVGLVNVEDISLAVVDKAGSSIMIIGAKTGRDGIHGATFASEELSESSQQKRPSVQVGDPFMEKLLIEACLESIRENLVSGMQDLGAAGLTSSIAETVSKKGLGAKIDVLKVPRREKDMTPYEIMLSESQERMLVFPKPDKEDAIRQIFDKWGLDAVVIGEITDDGLLKVCEGERLVGEVPVLPLTEGCPVYTRQGVEPEYYEGLRRFNISSLSEISPEEALGKLLSSPNIASKHWIFSQYDYQVMTNTIVGPGHGDAAVLRLKGTKKGIAITTDCNSRFVYLDPYRGGVLAVCEAARNLACVGAEPLALTNCLNFGNPEKPHIYWQMENTILGMSAAARVLNTPVVSGNVSLYNESANGAIFPTPVVGMVGLIRNISNYCDMSFKDPGDFIMLLGKFRAELGGSEYLYVCYGIEAGEIPVVDLVEEKRLIDLVLNLINKGLVKSAHDLSEGGLAIAVIESGIKARLGFELNIDNNAFTFNEVLFSEAPGRIVVSLSPEYQALVEEYAGNVGIECKKLGVVGGPDMSFSYNGKKIINLPVVEVVKEWEETIACYMNRK